MMAGPSREWPGPARLAPLCSIHVLVPSHHSRRRIAALLLSFAILLAAAASASATFAGGPGVVLFDRGSECSSHIFAVGPTGRGLRELGEGREAKFSPDGRRIAYTTPCDGAQTINIGVMDAAGGNPHVVISDGNGTVLQNPSFSPNGRRLIYVRAKESGYSVRTARVDGSVPTLLRRFQREIKFPSYTPNGRVIVLQVARQIYRMRPDGSRLRLLTAGAAPSISPGGHLLVYSHNGGIWTIRLDGTHRRQLVKQYSGGQHDQLRGLHVRSVSPTFSPDGELILFGRVGNRGKSQISSKLWVMRPDGSAALRARARRIGISS